MYVLIVFLLLLVSCTLGWRFVGRPDSRIRSISFGKPDVRSCRQVNSLNAVTVNSDISQTDDLSKNLTLGLSQLKPFLNIAIPFFKEDAKARNSLLGVGGMTLLNTGVSVAFSYISRDFYNALNARDEPMFYEKIELFFLALLVAVPVSVYYRFLREQLSLYWREALTSRALDAYFKDKKFYELEMIRDIDNPDQRIADDIRYFTRTSLDFFITLVTSIIDLFSFSAILFQIYPGLFAAIIAYAGVGSFLTSKIGGSLVELNYARLIKEANFRFSIIRTRENSESIAFYDSDAKSEKVNLWALFQEVVANQNDIINVRRNIESFTTAYRYLVQILPSLIVAPLYFQHQIELGAISQSYGAFNHILGDFSIIINQFESISAFTAGITRLSYFFDRLDVPATPSSNFTVISATEVSNNPEFRTSSIQYRFLEKQPEQAVIDGVSGGRGQSDALMIRFSNVTVLTPDRHRVVIGAIPRKSSDSVSDKGNRFDGVDLDIFTGDSVLILGPSGCGKSSFLRATAGLWSGGFGSVTWYGHRPSDASTNAESQQAFFLPQKPYSVVGSLRDQIRYPATLRVNSTADDESDELFLDLLKQVRLDSLALRTGDGNSAIGLRAVRDWGKILSLGEQQRLAFARVLYNKPSVVFLDGTNPNYNLSIIYNLISVL